MTSNAEKSRLLVEQATAWAARVEASGDTAKYLRGGVLNKSLVSEALGFSRSLWQSNPGLKQLAEQLDQSWGTKLSKQDLLGNLDRVLGEDSVPPNDGKSIHLSALLAQAGITAGQFQRHKELRQRLQEVADAHGLTLGQPGRVATEENAAGRSADEAELVPAARLREAQLRLAQAERKSAELKAEVASLRAQLQRNDEVAELIAVGGRIKPDTA